jgi:hypothetical protein
MDSGDERDAMIANWIGIHVHHSRRCEHVLAASSDVLTLLPQSVLCSTPLPQCACYAAFAVIASASCLMACEFLGCLKLLGAFVGDGVADGALSSNPQGFLCPAPRDT